MKGVSTLIASVLLIAITLLISLIISTSFTSIAKSQTNEISARITEAVNCTSSDMSIEDIFLDGGTGRVLVRNSGQISENLVRGLMLNSTGVGAAAFETYPISIVKGSIVTLTFNITGNITCSNFNRVTVTSQCTVATFDKKPRNC